VALKIVPARSSSWAGSGFEEKRRSVRKNARPIAVETDNRARAFEILLFEKEG
jgi:hypothetical protein